MCCLLDICEWSDDSVCVITCLFFFQAEDGIRDLVRSRGLGDVYKRQAQGAVRLHVRERVTKGFGECQTEEWAGGPLVSCARRPRTIRTVSYTHLTLPTSDLV